MRSIGGLVLTILLLAAAAVLPATASAAPIGLHFTSNPSWWTGTHATTFTVDALDVDVNDLSLTCSLDGAIAASCDPDIDLGSLSSGTHTLTVTGSDGEDAETVAFEWVISDTVGSRFLLTPPQFTKDETVVFEFESSAGTVSRDCRLDSGPWVDCTAEGVAQPTIHTEGQHTFSVRATDGSNGQDPATSYTWTADYTAPTITSNLPQLLGAGPFGLAVETDEPTTLLNCRLDDGEWVACSAVDLSGLTDGEHSLAAVALDRAGNEANRGFGFEVVSSGPIATITSGPPALISGNHAVTFAFSSATPGATFECSVNEQAFEPCTSPFTTTGAASSENTFRVRAVDVGFAEQPAASRAWSTVVNPFYVYFDARPDGWTSDRNANFVIKLGDTARADASYSCSLDGAPFAACSRFLSYSDLADGPHSLTVRAEIDEVTKQATADWRISDSVGSVIDSKPAAFSNSSSASLGWTTYGGADGVECRIDGDAWADCPEPDRADITGLSEGAHTFELRARSGSTYQDPVASYTWTVDTVAPSVVAGLPALVTTDPFDVSITADEQLLAAMCAVDPASEEDYADCQEGLTLTGLTEGAHTLSVFAIDRASNVSEQTIDFEWKPVKPVDPPSGGGGGAVAPPIEPSKPAKPSLRKPSRPKGGAFTVGYTCGDATCTIRGKLKLGSKTVKLKVKRVATGSGRAKILLDKKAKALLKHKARKKATLSVTISGAAGSTTSSLKF